MIKLGYLGETRNLDLKDSDIKLFIVRKPVNGIPFGFIHTPELSPSLRLFDDTKRWKNGEYTKEEREFLISLDAPLAPDSWWLLYKPRFEEELKEEPAKKLLERIEKAAEKKDVWIFCYCKDVDRCHRSIVGDVLKSKSLRVDYRRYTSEKEELNQMTFFDDF